MYSSHPTNATPAHDTADELPGDYVSSAAGTIALIFAAHLLRRIVLATEQPRAVAAGA